MNKKSDNFKKERGKIKIILAGAVLFFLFGIMNTFLKPENGNLSNFISASSIAISALEEYEAAIFLPGAGSNPTRNELNNLLESVLTKEMSEEKRLSEALLGLEKSKEVRAQIDEIEKPDLLLDKTILKLKTNASGLIKKDRESALFIVSLLQNYKSKAAEIKQFLYIINTNTEKIFEHIIEEEGTLSEEYIIALNEQIPEAETNFDNLSFLYRDLVEIKASLP